MARLPLYEERVQVFVDVEHPLAAAIDPIPLASLSDRPWILPGSDTALRGELEEEFARLRAPLPANRVETTNVLTVRELLRDRRTLAVLPALIGNSHDNLVSLPVDLASVSHQVGLSLAVGRALSPAAAAFVHALRRVAAEGLTSPAPEI
ncbi:hypothetical protein GCM10027169_17830 [Gordonia jinhuaensis]|uniref:LysR substrate-binding domain-containing protein n=1 Tax=Gordonia jinhuaensis TaxID=1517702 RepID=A0A916TIH0_9ACTN|nr:LysR substrate-binding domain-containing protein [Gordonia jinhuaensis]GGB46949.1 hypothetical protein GCM10011489_37740 [Gordonia jinhuaensis]